MFIVIANTKGGVGKSTLAVHLAIWLFDRGTKVALIDADKQRSSSRWIAAAESQITLCTTDSPEDCLLKAQGLVQSHDFVIGDGRGGLDEISRTMLLLAELTILPITPSLLDVWSVSDATELLRYAQQMNQGRPQGRLVLNRMKSRGLISKDLRQAAPRLGLAVCEQSIGDRAAFCDAVQCSSVVTRMGRRHAKAAQEIDALFSELLGNQLDSKGQHKRKEVVHG